MENYSSNPEPQLLYIYISLRNIVAQQNDPKQTDRQTDR